MNTAPFHPTHTVPQGGLDARSQADPNQQPVARLDPWLDVEVLRTWGAWAEISCSNGWTAWVDARVLVAKPPQAAAPPPPPPPPPPPVEGPRPAPSEEPAATPQAPVETSPVVAQTTQVPTVALPATPAYTQPAATPVYARPTSASGYTQPPPTGQYAPANEQLATGAPTARKLPVPAIVGGAIAAIGGVLPWIRAGGSSSNGFDVPLKFLVDYKTTGTSGINVGLVVLAAAIVGAVLAALPGKGAWQRLCGWACVLAGALYIVQMQRLLNAYTGSPSLVDTIGIGACMAVVGGLVLALAPEASE